MAELVIKTDNIVKNIHKINTFLLEKGLKWSLITKVLSGDKVFLKRILADEVIKGIHSIGDSRLSSLEIVKEINPDLKTMYIKPPAKQFAKTVVEFADISLNTSFDTISALNDEAVKQGKIHEVIIMIELGELREGVLRDKLMDFYERIFELPNIKVIGVGSNLGCMYGIEPTYDKLLQLSLYKQLLEVKFSKKMEVVSGGSSITLPLINKKLVPKDMNHFRIGEAAFFGTSPLYNKKFSNLSTDTFNFNANVLELEEKSLTPDGKISDASVGHATELEAETKNTKSFKAILDFGILDVDTDNLQPKDKNVRFVGTTSDMTVYDIGPNLTKALKAKYKVGKKIQFIPNYMAVARLMNSKFIDVKIR